MKIEELVQEFDALVENYNAEVKENGGHEGSCSIASLRSKIDLCVYLAAMYFNVELKYTRKP